MNFGCCAPFESAIGYGCICDEGFEGIHCETDSETGWSNPKHSLICLFRYPENIYMFLYLHSTG